VYEGPGWYKVGAHARGYNHVAIGTFTSSRPNSAARNAARQLISRGVSQVNFTLNVLFSLALL